MIRYEITIGNNLLYLSIPFDIDKQWIIDQLKRNNNFYGIEVNLEEISKEVKRIHPRTFPIGMIERADLTGKLKNVYKVINLEKIQIKEVDFYEGYSLNEILYEDFKNKNAGDKVLQIQEFKNRIMNEFNINERNFFDQLSFLITAKMVKPIYTVDQENFTDNLTSLRKYQPNEIYVGLEIL